MRKPILILILFSLCNIAQATVQPNYAVSLINENLIKKADAVIRSEQNVFHVKSVNEANLQISKVVTVLNRNGENFAPLLIHYDPQRKVRNIKCSIYDAQGNELKRIKNNDIEDFSANSSYSLYEDNRLKYYAYNSSQYPYTIAYSYEIEFNGLFYYPDWDPVSLSELAIEHSSYSITIPKDITFRYKAINMDEDPLITKEDEFMTYYWQLENFSAIENEPLSPDFAQLVPSLSLAPNDFEFEGHAGNMESWKNFGKWIHGLNKGRDILPEKTKSEVLALVEGFSDEEKIKKIYAYMQSKTRYVSIQLGIGGYQPFDAATVDKMGYGDCKALTNYTQALLKVAGIPSYYTLVRAGADAKPIDVDFPSTQFNHAILCVPLEKDTVWLECTDQSNPYNYLGYFTSDRNVLLIDENGGKLARTKAYDQEENLQIRNALVSLNDEGHGTAEIQTSYQGLQYEHISPILDFNQSEQKKIIYQKTGIPNFTLEHHDYEVKKDDKVCIEEKLNISLEKYGQVSNKRLFFTPNLLNQMDNVPPSTEIRKNSVVVNKAFVDADTIVYMIPESMYPEFIPESTHIITMFGEYSVSFQQEQGKITYVRTFKSNKGRFPASSYTELVDFYEQVVQKDAQKIVLKKST